ncbi:MAG: hypothetical protein JNL01_07255 [Bdellovibrionales bacterium]|nr:hypothetical protein [Bdellovibrionales bacterium]
MRVPVALAESMGQDFQNLIARFCHEQELIQDPSELTSNRFIERSVVPHVRKLSDLFNRKKGDAQKDEQKAITQVRYWKDSTNPKNLRLAYFIYFMPANAFRIAGIWSELHRLGFRFSSESKFKAIELGAGPATGACGVALGEKFSPLGLSATTDWALIERDRAMLQLGEAWTQQFFPFSSFDQWTHRGFHREIDFAEELVPKGSPKFNLWISSYFLNELENDPAAQADRLLKTWDRHLERDGLVILSEPALKDQSRRLLELRRELIDGIKKKKCPGLQILLPCLGMQNCGALAAAEDWCHEEVSWWRPPYTKLIDEKAGLDRKTLPFSYLVLTRSSRALEEILPGLKAGASASRHRLVSPSHYEGRDSEFFICGQDGKRRARLRLQDDQEVERGSILEGVEYRGDTKATRIDRLDRIV